MGFRDVSPVQVNNIIEQSGSLDGEIEYEIFDTAVGQRGYIVIPYNMTLSEVYLTAKPDTGGSIKIDIWVDDYANLPLTDADSICGGNEPEIVSDIDYHDTVLSGWNKTLVKGQIMSFYIDSVTSVTSVTIALLGTKS